MNRIFKLAILSLAGTVAVTSCYKEPVFEFAEKGPNTSITCDEAAYMGGKIDFMADLSDDKYPLSVINAKLYLDVETGDPVSEVEIRTESAGTCLENQQFYVYLPTLVTYSLCAIWHHYLLMLKDRGYLFFASF